MFHYNSSVCFAPVKHSEHGSDAVKAQYKMKHKI